MSSYCATPIKGVVLRIVQEDSCGNPVTGASSHVVVTNMWTQVVSTPQYEAGTDFFERTADGTLGVGDIDPPILKRLSLQIDLMTVDPDMMPYVISARELVSTAPVSGYGFALPTGPATAHFGLEVWQRVAGSGACSPGGQVQYIYHAFPHCKNAQVGAYTISNARSTLTFTCDTADTGGSWGYGPSTTKWLQTGGTAPQTNEHWLWNITTTAPPTAACGATVLS